MNKEIRKIINKLTEQGWTFEESSKHEVIAVPPDKSKRKIPLPSTPGGGRWLQNLKAQLRRSGADI